MSNRPETNKQSCPVYKKCGGCQLQNLSYPEQLEFKQRKVEKLLKRFCTVEQIIGMKTPYHYRNKVQAAFYTDKKGKIISGVYQSGSHHVVGIDSCQMEDVIADKIIVAVRKLLPSFRMTTYNEDTGKGFLRHILVKRGFATNQIMLVLVTGTPVFPSKNNFVKAILKQFPEITTIVQNINPYRTNLVLGDNQKVLYGKGYIEDILCGCRFRISPKSFYQINPVQTEVLYGKAIEFANLKGNETVLDTYCGIGTIGIIAAKNGAGNVIGAELNGDAVRDAIVNARANNLKNIRFYKADAGEFMREAADEDEKPDVVFMDPPRAGSDRKFLDSLIKMSPKKVVYVSCNPETLARDLAYLTQNSPYKAQKIQPVDMFPHTAHIETVVLLSRKKPDGHINVKVEFGEGEGKVPLDNIAKRAEEYKPKERVTYKMIKEYIEAKYSFKVHTAYIAEVKRDLGLPMYDAPNAVEELKQPRKHPTAEKVEAIKDALRYFEIMEEI
ncbi:23S rRNA (uracil(1939)-C(5))-methyltransferase RlmD [Ruminococcus sp. AF16-40]|nr:23S rRNA (uracil(1939)-C(5))-methyltransferase RlmD [Ruminococcus sp. AF16-40]RGG90481.1 23S rRNA (uracil(1939)-C(5))-methyltransferase RlmD [Ruminococcus sp. AF16-40]